MDFIDKLRDLSAHIPKQLEHMQTEEANKNTLVLPFLSALGYNVFDPTEVTPELTADVGTKEGEKGDYAILRDGKPLVLVECNHHTVDLGKAHTSQLYRYFGVTEARVGVLTNGIVYWSYTDLESPNKMDVRPFLEFNMLDIREVAVEELKKFSKSATDLDSILTAASELMYAREIRRIIAEQTQEPSDELVRFNAAQVYTGKLTQSVRQHFAQLTKQALKQVVNEQINERLKTTLASETATPTSPAAEPVPAVTAVEAVGTQPSTDDIKVAAIAESNGANNSGRRYLTNSPSTAERILKVIAAASVFLAFLYVFLHPSDTAAADSTPPSLRSAPPVPAWVLETLDSASVHHLQVAQQARSIIEEKREQSCLQQQALLALSRAGLITSTGRITEITRDQSTETGDQLRIVIEDSEQTPEATPAIVGEEITLENANSIVVSIDPGAVVRVVTQIRVTNADGNTVRLVIVIESTSQNPKDKVLIVEVGADGLQEVRDQDGNKRGVARDSQLVTPTPGIVQPLIVETGRTGFLYTGPGEQYYRYPDKLPAKSQVTLLGQVAGGQYLLVEVNGQQRWINAGNAMAARPYVKTLPVVVPQAPPNNPTGGGSVSQPAEAPVAPAQTPPPLEQAPVVSQRSYAIEANGPFPAMDLSANPDTWGHYDGRYGDTFRIGSRQYVNQQGGFVDVAAYQWQTATVVSVEAHAISLRFPDGSEQAYMAGPPMENRLHVMQVVTDFDGTTIMVARITDIDSEVDMRRIVAIGNTVGIDTNERNGNVVNQMRVTVLLLFR